MRTRGRHRFDRVTAEQMLAGDPAADGALARLLAAADGPARDDELAGEDAAVALWRSADSRPRPAAPHRRWRVRLAAVKVSALALIIGAGSVALAASTGVLTGPSHPARPGGRPSHTVTAGSTTTRSATTSPSAAPSPTDRSSGPATPGSSTHPNPAGSEALTGLCHAYTAAIANGHSDVLDKPDYAVLITAAGGRGQVASFCAALLATVPGHRGPTPAPHPSATPDPHPSGGPGNGTPGGRPSGSPTTHPGR